MLHSEWPVLYPGRISAFEILPPILNLTKKKSKWQCISGLFRLQVYLFSSGFKSLHMSVRSKLFWIDLSSFKEFQCVVCFPAFLSFKISKTRLKSPPRIISSHLNNNKYKNVKPSLIEYINQVRGNLKIEKHVSIVTGTQSAFQQKWHQIL